MNKLVLLLGIIGSSAALSSVELARVQTKLGSEAPPMTIGGVVPASISDVHPAFKLGVAHVQTDPGLIEPALQGHLAPVGLSAIRERQTATGLHAYSSKYDHTRNSMRN